MMKKLPILGVALFSVAVVSCGKPQVLRPAPASAPATWFADFPVGDTWTFKASFAPSTLTGLPVREEREQLRDWLLASIIGVSGQPIEDTAKTVAGLPIWRENLTGGTPQDLPRGSARATVLPNHYVVAIVPKESDRIRRHRLGDLLDQVQFDDGPQTGNLELFE